MRYLGTHLLLAMTITSLAASCCGSTVLDWRTVQFERANEHAGKMIAQRIKWRRGNKYASAPQVADVGCQAVIGVLQQIFDNEDAADIGWSMEQIDRIENAIDRKLDGSRTKRRTKLEKKNQASTQNLQDVKAMLRCIREAYQNKVLTHEILQADAPDPRWSQAYGRVQGGVIKRMVHAIRQATHQQPAVPNVASEHGGDGDDGQSVGGGAHGTLASVPAEQPPPLPEAAGPPVAPQDGAAADAIAREAPVAPRPAAPRAIAAAPAEQSWWQQNKETVKKARNYALGLTGAALLLDVVIRKKKSLLYKAGNGIGKASKKVWHWLTGKNESEQQLNHVSPEEAAALAQQLLAEAQGEDGA